MINKNPNHKHTYDSKGNRTCCSLEDKIYSKANAKALIKKAHTEDEHNHEGHTHDDDDHDHSSEGPAWKQYLPAIISFVMLLLGIAFDNYLKPTFYVGYVRLIWYIIAYLPVGIPVMKDALVAFGKRKFFTEFSLMVLATVGAFAIQQYPEGVAVMLFYAIGELVQTAAVNRSKRSIQSLLDVRPDTVNVLRNNTVENVKAETVSIDEIIQVKAGEKIGLDGVLLSETGSFNTAALTGESKPDTKEKAKQF